MWDGGETRREWLKAFAGGDNRALPMVYGIFAGSDAELLWEAAWALALRMEELEPEPRIRFLERMGQYTSMEWYTDWTEISPARLRGQLDERGYFAALAAGSFHPNGYYREKCLRELIAYGGRALPYLMLRANDWVEPVREAALEASRQIVTECPPEVLLDALPFLYHLGLGQRRDQAGYLLLKTAAERRLAENPPLLAPKNLRKTGRTGIS